MKKILQSFVIVAISISFSTSAVAKECPTTWDIGEKYGVQTINSITEKINDDPFWIFAFPKKWHKQGGQQDSVDAKCLSVLLLTVSKSAINESGGDEKKITRYLNKGLDVLTRDYTYKGSCVIYFNATEGVKVSKSDSCKKEAERTELAIANLISEE